MQWILLKGLLSTNILSYTQEKMLNSLSYWLGTSHCSQTSHCHMQVIIPNNLA